MSGDETDGSEKVSPPRYRILVKAWQSDVLKNFLRLLDQWYREDWAAPVGTRATPGNPPRTRVSYSDVERNPKLDRTPAPIGLWRNCYSPVCLQSLKPHVLESLQIINSDYDFSDAACSGKDKGKGRRLY